MIFRWLAVALRFSARRLLALSTRLSPPVPLPASHPAARAVLARAGGVEFARGGVIHPRPEDDSVRARLDTGCAYTAGATRYVGRDGSEWTIADPGAPGVQLTPMPDPYRQEKP